MRVTLGPEVYGRDPGAVGWRALADPRFNERRMAEREGFEPSVQLLTVRRFSKPLLSTTQPPLREGKWSEHLKFNTARIVRVLACDPQGMADRMRAVPENVEGPLFVDSTCIDCDTCRQIAP